MFTRNKTVATLVMMFVSAVACSRSAEQTNFLGKACSGQADCPAELLCVAEACWKPCGPGGTCASNEVCTFGACVPSDRAGGDGGAVTPPDGNTRDADVGIDEPVEPDDKNDSGATDPRDSGEEKDPDSGAEPPANDGTVVLSNLPADLAMQTGGVTLDDTDLVYIVMTQDDFGQQAYDVMRQPLAGGAPTMVKQYLQPLEGTIVVANGGLFYKDRNTGGAPPMSPLVRVDLATGTESEVLPDLREIIGIVGSRLAYVTNQPEHLHFLDPSSVPPTLDATNYGPIRGDKALTVSGTAIAWLDSNLDEPSSPFELYTGTLGVGATKSPRTFPGTATLHGMLVAGTNGVVLVGDPPKLSGFDPTQPSGTTPRGTLGFVHPSRQVFSGEGRLYFFEERAAASGSDLVALTIDGTRTKFGSAKNVSDPAIFATSTSIYVIDTEMGPGGPGATKLYRWTKPGL